MAPEVVIRIGPQPVSKPLTLFLAAVKPKTYVVFDESAMMRDAQSVVTHHIQSAAKGFVAAAGQNERKQCLYSKMAAGIRIVLAIDGAALRTRTGRRRIGKITV
nr:hypothetical protein [Planococcus glaciei]